MNERTKRQVRFLLLLPVITVPFTAVVFWLLGGGSAAASVSSNHGGLNTRLPGANISKDSARDKLSFYELAMADSLRKESVARSDPFLRAEKTKDPELEVDVEEKLKNINKRNRVYEYYNEPKQRDEPTRRVEYRETSNPSTVRDKDPEIEAINQTIEKLKALQSPSPKATKTVAAANTIQATQVESEDDSFFGRKDTNRFNSFMDDRKETANGFSAIIPYTQIVQSGMPVRIRLEKAMKCGVAVIPKGSELTGIAALEGERMMIKISAVQVQSEIIPVSLTVFDPDGLEGIYVPGSLQNEVLKSTADQSLQSVNVLSLDPSIKAQLAAAGISAAKGLLSKKVKAIRATITAGYKIILRNEKKN